MSSDYRVARAWHAVIIFSNNLFIFVKEMYSVSIREVTDCSENNQDMKCLAIKGHMLMLRSFDDAFQKFLSLALSVPKKGRGVISLKADGELVIAYHFPSGRIRSPDTDIARDVEGYLSQHQSEVQPS
jgi:hypothetical protein